MLQNNAKEHFHFAHERWFPMIQEGNVVMTKVSKDKMYYLEIEVLTQDDLKVVHANVARLFGVETKKKTCIRCLCGTND
jgi:cupin superfamily acireductone dioxygenase involved in methionine salvage